MNFSTVKLIGMKNFVFQTSQFSPIKFSAQIHILNHIDEVLGHEYWNIYFQLHGNENIICRLTWKKARYMNT